MQRAQAQSALIARGRAGVPVKKRSNRASLQDNLSSNAGIKY
jgi:hypothetical protein